MASTSVGMYVFTEQGLPSVVSDMSSAYGVGILQSKHGEQYASKSHRTNPSNNKKEAKRRQEEPRETTTGKVFISISPPSSNMMRLDASLFPMVGVYYPTYLPTYLTLPLRVPVYLLFALRFFCVIPF